MKQIIILCLLLLLFGISSAKTGIEIGLTGNSGWTSNKYLEDPDGWGFFIAKSLSQNVTVRFSFDRFSKDTRYYGVMQFGFLLPNPDTTREFIATEARVHFYELSLHHVIVNGNKMRLDAGGGFGYSKPKLTLYGETTGKTINSADDNKSFLSFSIDVTVKQFITTPLSLRFGYKYRTISSGALATDIFYAFDEISLSNVNINLILRL